MKKLLFLSLIVIIILHNLYGQSQRIVLLEQFTNVGCGPCASANPGIVSLYNSNTDKMVLIYYHVNFPSATDPMFTVNPTEITNRMTYYTVSAVPTSALDGVSLGGGVTPTQNNVNNNYAVSSPFTIKLFHEIIDGVITVEMIITKTGSTTGTLIAQIAVIEEIMTYSTAPGSNGETEFHNVFKKFMPNQYGTVLKDLNIGDSLIITKSWTYTNVLDSNNLRAVAFIQNNSDKEVLQAGMSIAKTNIMPGADFVANTRIPCTGEVKFSDLSSSVTSWSWNFGDGTVSSEQNPTHIYKSNGTYTITLSVLNTNGADSVTKINYIIADMPETPVTTDGYGNSGDLVTLSATGNGILNWYSQQTGGTFLNTGNTYVTPVLYSSTDYYVESSVTDVVQKVGKTDKETTAGGYFTANDIRGEFFDVYKPCLLKSVKVYANTAGKRTIEVTQGDGGPVVHTKTITLPLGEQRVTLDFQMEPGIDYFIKCKNIDGAILDLWRDNANATYPHTIDGVISITNSNAGTAGFWYFFYDWEIEGGPCVSPRSKVTAHINNGVPEDNLPQVIKLIPNPTSGEITLQLTSFKNENVLVNVFDINGKLVYSEKINIENETEKKFDFSSFSKGIYIVKIIASQHIYNEKLIIE